MSRDGTAACCGDPGTLALAEQTNVTGRLAGMSFHNAGYDEGNMELTSSSGRGRRINFHDNQGVGMRVEADDFYIRASGKWASQLGGGTTQVYSCPNQPFSPGCVECTNTCNGNLSLSSVCYTYTSSLAVWQVLGCTPVGKI